ncbi:MAG: hypothetical protein K8W52_24740 [Deltaproteobacteria bacterium]|nr:hypothetical protein [Deltaproteobacteria bacterium]
MRDVARVLAIAVGAIALFGGRAHADTLLCEEPEADELTIDGMLDDWGGVKKARLNGGDRDASLELRCLADRTTLWLAVDVKDEHVVRSATATPGDDRLELKLDAGGAALTIAIAPGVGKLPPTIAVNGRRERAVVAETSLQPAGWSVELAIPLAKVAGYGASTSAVTVAYTLRDGDVPGSKTPETTLTDRRTLSLPGGTAPADPFQAFLDATGLGKAAIALDTKVELDKGTPGLERVIAGKRVIGLLGERFSFVQLPADRDDDVIGKVAVADLRGDGSKVVLAVVRQRGAGAVRDVLLGFGAHQGQLAQLFAIEVRRERDGHRLESQWKLAAKGRPAGKGPVLEVVARKATGWDADSYAEEDASDAQPIALPWDDDRWGARYWLIGDKLSAAPMTGARPNR